MCDRIMPVHFTIVSAGLPLIETSKSYIGGEMLNLRTYGQGEKYNQNPKYSFPLI